MRVIRPPHSEHDGGSARGYHPDFDWRGIADFRNYVVHDYLGVGLGIVWKVVTEDVPKLKALILRMLE